MINFIYIQSDSEINGTYVVKLVGRTESIHMQRKWCYGFSHYTTGRVGDFSVFEKASTEARDRSLARTVPRSR